MPTALRHIYQVRIQLNDIEPTIWRRFLITNTATIAQLHSTLQTIMGWQDYHLHEFHCNNKHYAIPYPEFDMDAPYEVYNAYEFTLKDLLKKAGDSLLYRYDFGDGWEHTVTLEKTLPFDKAQRLPRCLEGERNCPPEDVGGVWGYEDFLEQWRDKKHPEHHAMRTWAGDFLGPEYFDHEKINRELCAKREKH